LYGTAYNTVYRIPPGAAPVAIGTLDDERQEGSHRWPSFLPDGTHFLFTIRGGMPEQTGVFVGSLDGTTKKRLVRSDAGAFYASGYLLFLDVEGNAKAQVFDVASLELSGQPFSIPASVGRSSMAYTGFSVSRGGGLAYSSALLSQGQLTWIDRSGKPSGKVGPEGDYSDFRLSHNWSRLASSLIDAKTGNIDISVTDLGQGGTQASDRTQKLTFGPALNAAAVWSPDDALIAYRTTRTGGFVEFYKRSSAGGGKEEPVLLKAAALAAGVHSLNICLTDWTLNGLLYSESSPTGSSLWRLPFVGDGKPVRLVHEDKAQLMHGNVSPDGRMVAYTSNESGRFDVWIQTVPASDKKKQVSIDGGYEPRWRDDGSELYFLSMDRKLMFVTVGPNLSFGIPRELFQTRVPAGITHVRTHYVPNRDGSRFLVNTQVGDPAPAPITIVLNWIQGLKK
jgi:Tol biopolymer transport system component